MVSGRGIAHLNRRARPNAQDMIRQEEPFETAVMEVADRSQRGPKLRALECAPALAGRHSDWNRQGLLTSVSSRTTHGHARRFG
jgi:hypothetical protein